MAINELGFDPEKVYAPLNIDAFDNKQLFGNDTFDVIVDLELMKYDEYYLIKEFIIQNIFNNDYDFSIMDDMDEEAIFTLLFCRPHKNPLECFIVNKGDKDLNKIWKEFKLENKDRIFKYVKTELYDTIVNMTISSDIGNIYILVDDIPKGERLVVEGELLENVHFRRDKIKFIYARDKSIVNVYRENMIALDNVRVFILDDIMGCMGMLELNPKKSFAGRTFIIPKRPWNVFKTETLGFGKLDRIAHDFDIYAMEKFVDVKVIDLLNINPNRDLAVG